MLRLLLRARHATIRGLPEGVPPLSLEGSGPGSTPPAFGPFRVLHQLGAGTLGPVFRAHDPVEGRLVAVKAFKLDLTPERAVELAHALDELVSRELNHPAIAAPLATGVESSTTWLAQSYVPAESLDAALRQFGPAPIAHVVTIVTQLAGALDFAAAAGVLHGSLHPRDVLVVPGEAFLIDLGVAPALERCGIRTPVRRPYSAPERIAGAPASRAADVFALGAMAVELLVGQPIAGAGADALAPLPEIAGSDAAALQTTLAAALAIDPEARPATALAFASAFRAALGTASFRNTPAVAVRRTPRSMPMLPLEEPGAAVTDGPPLVSDGTGDVSPETAAGVPPLEAPPETQPPVHAASPAESPRFSQTEPDELDFDLALPVSRERSHEASAVPIRPHARRSTRRSIPAAVVVVVLAAAVAGFGIGWLWSTQSPAGDDEREPQTTIGVEASPETAPIGTEDSEGSPPAAEASTGVESPASPVQEAAAGTDPDDAVAPVVGRLLVRSSPAGAAVQINGRSRGQTPLTVRDLPLGSHTVVVSRPGYSSERRTVRLTEDRAARSLQISLRETAPAGAAARQTFEGTVVVESRPRAARVVLNGKDVGRTPLTIPSVRAGSHVVRLEMDGYRTWTASVRVVAGQRNRVTASLEEMP